MVKKNGKRKTVMKKSEKKKQKECKKIEEKSGKRTGSVISKTPKKCPICGKIFIGKTNNFTRHIREQHSAEKELYICPLCPHSSQWKKNIRAHFMKKHADEEADLSDLETIKVPNQST